MVASFYRTQTEPVIANEETPPPAKADPALDLTARLRKHEQFVSAFVEQRHDLIVYLPPSYEAEAQRRFSVLYMHDGQNLFDGETSFIRGNYWRLGETADRLIEAGSIESLIIVGVYNAGEKRIDEYTPGKDKHLGGGKADCYGRMIVEELKPFIDATYRTLPGAEHCGMGGSSLGGLVTLYLGLRYPHVFSRLAVMSPSVWWRNRAILKTVTRLAQKPALLIWLDVGAKEGPAALADTQLLRDRLVQKGWTLNDDLCYLEAGEAEHTESAWAERVAPMLKFLFGNSGRS